MGYTLWCCDDNVTAVHSYLWTWWAHDSWNVLKSNFFFFPISLKKHKKWIWQIMC